MFEAVTEARAAAQQAQGPPSTAQAEGILSQALGRLFAVAEAYPELRATENFQELQAQLSDTEDKVAVSRQVYNDTVLTYHNAIQTFPGTLFAGPVRLHEARVLRGRGRGSSGRLRPSTSSARGSRRVPRSSRCRPRRAADGFSLLSADVGVAAAGRRLGRRERASRGRVLRRLPLRLPRHPAPQGRVARRPARRRARRSPTRRGNNTRARAEGDARDVRRRTTRRQRADRLVLQRASDQTRAFTDLVHAARPRRRVRRRRRRQPEGLGRPVGRSRSTASSRSRRRPGKILRAWGHPVWVRGDVELDGNAGDAARRRRPGAPVRRAADAGPALRVRVDGGDEASRAETASPRIVDAGARRREEIRAATTSGSTRSRRTRAYRPRAARPRDDPRPPRHRPRLLVHGARAPDRLRPRVRAGAANGHRARARPHASPAGRRCRLATSSPRRCST